MGTVQEFIDEASSVACIDGKNLERVAPLREFLQAYGITVKENSITDLHCLYHIAIGTSNEVKDIFSRSERTAYRRLAILFEATNETPANISKIINAKVALIGDRLLEQEEPRVIFGFLCDNDSSVKDLRKPEETAKSNSKNMETVVILTEGKELPVTSHWQEDEQRIKTTIKDVYSKKSSKKPTPLVKMYARGVLLGLVFIVFSHVFSVIASIVLFAGSYFLYSRHVEPFPVMTLSRVFMKYAQLIFSPVTFTAPSLTRTYERTLAVIYQSEELFTEVISINQLIDLASVFSNGQQPSQTSIYAQLSRVKTQGERMQLKLSLIEADIQLLIKSIPDSLSWPKNYLINIDNKIKKSSEVMGTLLKLSTLYPLLSPPGETRNYLLIFQNSAEVRPTGGFIGSVGNLDMANGSINSITIDDVYTYDGQLRGHVDPPLPIRTILQQEHWYLRDSNWDPDFEVSGEKAAWFYEKSGGKKVDGVIAISLPFIQDLLEVTGPIRISELSEPVSKDTIFPIVHTQIEEDFFPGSTKKKDILGSIFRKLIEEITTRENNQLKLTTILAKALKNKTIQLYTKDLAIQEITNAYNWSGDLSFPQYCREADCITDFLYIVEANVGVNKANTDVSRSLTKQLSFTPTNISSQDDITITNESDSSTTGGGEYTTYMRLYYPAQTIIKSLTINDVPVSFTEASMSAKPFPYAEILNEKDGFITLGIAVNVRSHSQAKITVVQELSVSQQFTHYAFSSRPQAGTGSLPVTLKGVLPDSWKATIERPEGLFAVSKEFEYTTRTDYDDTVVISF